MMPTDAQARKETPIYSGFMAFFPDAIAAVARHSFRATKQHHPFSVGGNRQSGPDSVARPRGEFRFLVD